VELAGASTIRDLRDRLVQAADREVVDVADDDGPPSTATAIPMLALGEQARLGPAG
jgi:hypothetical protein